MKKINNTIAIVLVLFSFFKMSAFQRGSGFGFGPFATRAQPMSAMEMMTGRRITTELEKSSTVVLNTTEWKQVIERILENDPQNVNFSSLNNAFNDVEFNRARMSKRTSGKIYIYYDDTNRNVETIQLSTTDLELFDSTKAALQNPIEEGAEPIAPRVDVAAPVDSIQRNDADTATTTVTAPVVQTPAGLRPATTVTPNTTTAPAPTIATRPAITSASSPAAQAQQTVAPAAVDSNVKNKKGDKEQGNDDDRKHPYGYPPYYPYDQEKSANASAQNSGDQSMMEGGAGRGGSRGGRNRNNSDPYSGFNDPYYGGMGGGYDAPMSVYSGGGMYYDRPTGYVGRSLPDQVGFAIIKPSNTPPQYIAHADLKKLSSQGKSITVAPEVSSDKEFTPTRYQRTVELEAEPLYHKRITDSNKRLRIAPVTEDPILSPEEQTAAILPETPKKPVSFFASLWNTVTEPVMAFVHWFFSIFYRK